jgi:NAD(P)-dependent dehydrogenase (short-subunit alcohol dehydrogenase family)
MAHARHALVTGGGSGVGAAIALALAQSGAVVTICGRRMEPLQDVAARHENIHAHMTDVTDEDSLQQLYRQARAARGDFGIVVANAGMSESAPAHATSLDLWEKTIAANLTGAFLSVRPVLKPMQEAGWGRVIFVASTAGLKGYPYVAPYVAAKHGVIGLMRALAAEMARTGVTVNAICPGFTETPMLAQSVEQIMAKTGRSEREARDALSASNPQGRFIQPGEVAEVALWLCSENSGSVTGQAISVSGGEV